MNFVFQSTFSKSKAVNYTVVFSVICFLLLFHQVEVGLNLAIFDVLMLLFFLSGQPARFKDSRVIITSFCLLLTAGCVAWYGTPDTIIWSIITLGWLSQLIHFPENTFLLAETKGFINLFTAPIQQFTEIFSNENEQATVERLKRGTLVVGLPLLFALLFASLYRGFNPFFETGFDSLFANMNWSLGITTLLGLFVAIYLLKPHLPARLNFIDQILGDNFSQESEENTSAPNSIERQTGLALFSMLNLLLLIFLVSDVAFVSQLTAGVNANYSKYVHQGVETLIFLLVLAASFILFFFRKAGESRLPMSNRLKALALVWMILNIGLIVTTSAKNVFYVLSYGLTLKRIGVFVYLALSLAGLAFTISKISLAKTNAYLFRKLYWSFFIILTVNLCIDWSSITTRFNLHENIKDHRDLDWAYLLQLNERVIPIIYGRVGQLHLPEGEENLLKNQLAEKQHELRNYNPDWRELNLAKVNAKSEMSKL